MWSAILISSTGEDLDCCLDDMKYLRQHFYVQNAEQSNMSGTTSSVSVDTDTQEYGLRIVNPDNDDALLE